MENYYRNRQNKGITLIALVITIIVLLILAGVTVNTLVGENGIINRTITAREETKKAEYIERARLDLIDSIIEKSVAGENKEIGTDDLKTQLKKNFTEESVESALEEKGKINDEEYRKITKLIAEDGTEVALYDLLKEITVFVQAIDYGEKSAQTIETGDDLTIGGTEKFKVIKKEENKITAMPYYNISLEAPYKQKSDAGRVTFSSSAYWSGLNDSNCNIDMSGANNVQTYINEYEKTLRKMGASNVTARIARIKELRAKDELDNSLLTYDMKNPGHQGDAYWTGSYYSNAERDLPYVHIVATTGDDGGSQEFNNNFGAAVRPVIEITITQ